MGLSPHRLQPCPGEVPKLRLSLALLPPERLGPVPVQRPLPGLLGLCPPWWGQALECQRLTMGAFPPTCVPPWGKGGQGVGPARPWSSLILAFPGRSWPGVAHPGLDRLEAVTGVHPGSVGGRETQVWASNPMSWGLFCVRWPCDSRTLPTP